MSFVHLHVHSDYSLSEGASKIGDLIEEAKRQQMPALALTDTDNLYGALQFSQSCAKSGIQPIIGAHLRGHGWHLTLLAQTEAGYQRLCALPRDFRQNQVTSDTNVGQFLEPLFGLGTEGLICLVGGSYSNEEAHRGLLDYADDKGQLHDVLNRLKEKLFGDRLYVEINRTGRETQAVKERQERIVQAAHDNEVPLVATSEVFYATSNRHQAYEILQAVTNDTTITGDENALQERIAHKHHLRSQEEMEALFPDLPEALRNTAEIARRCAFMPEPCDPILPPYPTQDGRTEDEELKAQAEQGLRDRLDGYRLPDDMTEEDYWARLEHELGIINSMGFPGYFLIVADFVSWAKQNGVPVGPARGSGAGSIVAWAMQITEIDPLRFNLLFERFLNPERISMPDFDIDFCQDGRDHVINYVHWKYGTGDADEATERISQIATHSGIQPKTAMRDAARTLVHDEDGKLNFGEINEVSKKLEAVTSIQNMDEEAPEIMQTIRGDRRWLMAYNGALMIEGLYRQAGTHAGGIVIGDRPLNMLIPVGWDTTEKWPRCQFDKNDAEEAGLVKFDFLGLKNLSIIRRALTHVERFRGISFSANEIPFDDPATFDLLQRGDTTAVFQLGSSGMREMLRNMQPTRLEDIIAAVALYRPGPMQNIPSYNARRHGTETITYPEPAELTRPILEETFGIIIYQEQVMQIAQKVAGYSLGQADILRKAMGKKDPDKMAKQHESFVDGCLKNGVSKENAEGLWDYIKRFAEYGFNKSHATAYAVVAYQTAYLKAHFPEEFFAASMSYDMGDEDKLRILKDDLDEHGISLVYPDINRSYLEFVPEITDNETGKIAIRFGFGAIKTVPSQLETFLGEREKNGRFESLTDFSNRAGHLFNKKQMQRLAEVGAFNDLAPSRRAAYEVLDWLSKAQSTENDLFGGAAAPEIPREKWDIEEWGNVPDREQQALGFYLSEHPFDPYMARLYRANVKRRKRWREIMYERDTAEMKNARMCVMIDKVTRKSTTYKRPMLLVSVSEKNDSYTVAVFDSRVSNSTTLEDLQKIFEEGRKNSEPVVILADLTLENNDVRVKATNASLACDYTAHLPGHFKIWIAPDEADLTTEERRNLAETKNGERNAVADRIIQRHADDLIGLLKNQPTTDSRKKASHVEVWSATDTPRKIFDTENDAMPLIKVNDTTLEQIRGCTGVHEITELDPEETDY